LLWVPTLNSREHPAAPSGVQRGMASSHAAWRDCGGSYEIVLVTRQQEMAGLATQEC